MQLNLQHSLRLHLASVTGLTVVWMMDGVKLPADGSKPFMTIEQMQNNNRKLSKGREAFETIYRFQIGLRADTATNRSRLQDVIKRSLHFDNVPYIDLAQSPATVSGFFNTNLTGEVPISADSVADKSSYHRVYFDVEIDKIIYA